MRIFPVRETTILPLHMWAIYSHHPNGDRMNLVALCTSEEEACKITETLSNSGGPQIVPAAYNFQVHEVSFLPDQP